MERLSTEWEIFASDISNVSNSGLISKICKKFIPFSIKKKKPQSNQMANRYMRTCVSSLNKEGNANQNRYDIIHRKSLTHHQETTKLVKKFGKGAGYKINIQKPIAFLYTNNKLLESKKAIPFTNASKRIKYLQIIPRRWMKTIRHWWKISRTTYTDGKKPHRLDCVRRLEELLLLKWPY